MGSSDGSAEEALSVADAPAPALSDELALLPLLNTLVFPLTITPLAASHPASLQLIDEALEGRRLIAVVALRQPGQRPATIDEQSFYPIGTTAIIHKLVRFPDGALRVALQGLERIRVSALLRSEPYAWVRAERLPDAGPERDDLQALADTTATLAQDFAALLPHVPDELALALEEREPRQLAYQLASAIYMSLAERQTLLELPSVSDRLAGLEQILRREIGVLELSRQLRSEEP